MPPEPPTDANVHELDVDDVVLPVKRTDGETLKDRLTDNAYENLLPARYLRKDENGNVVEAQEDLFDRVAKNIAVADAAHHDDSVLVRPDDVKPDHPRRGDLVAEVWGSDDRFDVTCDEHAWEVTPVDGDDVAIELTDDNASHFAYETVHAQAPAEVAETMETQADAYRDLMERLAFQPNSPTIMNSGDELQQLSACFVRSPEDDIEDIHETATEAALTFQSGGGLGYAFSNLRPYGDTVGSTGGIASGPITFMRTYDQMCQTIAQGGARRGAQMGIMSISHPDIIQFIHAKNKDVSLAYSLRLNDPDDFTHNSFKEALEEARELIDDDGKVPEHLRNAVEGHLSNFNISVGVTDDFMQALKAGEEYTLINPRTDDPHIATPETKELYEQFGLGNHVKVGEELSVPAEALWDDIIEGAHENGEPGVVYLDRINDDHSFDVDEYPEYEINSTNPCVAEGTLVNTPDGPRRVETIEEGDEISTVIGSEPVDEIEVHDDHDVHRVKFSDGGALDVTAQHRFHVLRDSGKEVEEIPLHEVEEGNHVRLHPSEMATAGTNEDYRQMARKGVLIGDGCVTENAVERNRVTINTSVDDKQFNKHLKQLFGEDRFRMDDDSCEGKAKKLVMSDGGTEVESLGITPAPSPERSFDPTGIDTQAEAIGILDGLLATDGNINLHSNHPQIRWDTASKELAHSIRNTLLGIGIHGRITCVTNPKRGGTINGRKVSANHPLYTINVSGASARRYAEFSRIDELHPRKAEQLFKLRRDWMTTGNTWKAKIESVEPVEETTTVYDLYCEESDTWITEGYVQRGCGEQPLMNYEACNLGHINLSTLAAEEAPDWRVFRDNHGAEYESTEAAVSAFLKFALDWDEFNDRIALATRFLDNVVTMSNFPTPEFAETVRDNRKIGLGIMGLAQLYIQLGVRYGTDAGDEIARQVMQHINHNSKRASAELAKERGAFNNWEDSKYADPTAYREWFERQTGLNADDWPHGLPIRNHSTTTIAPTGSTSMIGNTSGGCEPIYNVAYYKNVSGDVQGDEMLVEFDDYFLRVLEANSIDVEAVKQEAQEQMASNEFDGVDGLETVPDAIGELFVTTTDLSAEQHASVQCALQDGVDSAISKTTNAPHDSTVADAKDVFEYIYDHGGKGVTYYRDGTRSKQVLTTRAQNTDFADMDEEEAADAIVENIEDTFGTLGDFLASDHVSVPDETNLDRLFNLDEADIVSADTESGMAAESATSLGTKRPRPDVLHGVTQRVDTGYGKLYVNINQDPKTGEPFELFANIGNSGGFTASFTEALAKNISTALRCGVDPAEIASELQGIRSPKVAWDAGRQIDSIPDAIGVAMERYLEDELTRPEEPDQATLEQTAEPAEDTDADGLASTPPQQTDGGTAATSPGSAPNSEGDNVGDNAERQSPADKLLEQGEAPECPECHGDNLDYAEGCVTCVECGWSKC